jgi:hypothetical protein
LLLVLALAACERPRDLTVRVSIPAPDGAEAPVAGVGVVALPYDRDSVLRALESRAPSPRPAGAAAALDTLFHRFREPFAAFAAASERSTRLRDSVQAARTELDSSPADARRRAELQSRIARQSDSLAAAEQRTERARTALDQARRTLLPRIDSLRARLRSWEDSTYQGYDSIVRGLAQRSRREAVTDTTNADGLAHLRLAGGPWWIYARSWDASDPNSEWYWNVPVPEPGDTVRLDGRSGKQRPKY